MLIINTELLLYTHLWLLEGGNTTTIWQLGSLAYLAARLRLFVSVTLPRYLSMSLITGSEFFYPNMVNQYIIGKLMITQKQSPRRVLKKGVLRNFAKFTIKHLCQGLFFDKVAGLHFNWNRDSGTGVFQWTLQNFWILFLQNTSGDCFL